MNLEHDFQRYVCQTSDEPIGIVVERAFGCTIVDANGKEYIDFISGIGVTNVGHTNPEVLHAIREQIERHLHVMVYGEYIQASQVELASLLARVAPFPLSVTFFSNSGAEAVEGALKTARKYTGRSRLIAFENSYHGDTMGALSVMGNGLYRKPFEPLLADVTFLPFNEREALERIDEKVAAVIVEPIQAEAGVRVPNDDFFPMLRERTSKVGALLIFDEVVTGFGRTGKMFACEHWNVVPDILVMAKGMGGGMPLGGFIGAPEVMRTLAVDPPLSHVTTFGGHPVSCAAGVAGIKYLLEHKLPERAAFLGPILQEQLRRLSSVGGVCDVRGKGLLIGLELTNSHLTRAFVHHCRELGLLLGWTLHSDTVVRLAPPLVISDSEIERSIGIMKEALQRTLRETKV